MKIKLRKINIEGNSYLWKVEHYHLEKYEYAACVDKVTVYLKEYKNSPLKLHFRLEDNKLVSKNPRENNWFMDAGCLLKGKRVINLNRPGVIAKLISYYIKRNWKPKEVTKALEIEDALKLVALIEFPEG